MAVYDHFEEYVPKGSLVFDIGANVGYKTKELLDNGAGKVIAVEPQPNCCEGIINRFPGDNRVVVLNVAVGSSARIGKVKICKSQHESSSMSDQWINKMLLDTQFQWEGEFDVTVVTFDMLIAQYGIPNFCKIDVEGYEYEVMLGLSHSIPALCFEFYYGLLGEITFPAMVLLECLHKYEYNYIRQNEKTFALQYPIDAVSLMNELKAEGHNRHEWGDIYARAL